MHTLMSLLGVSIQVVALSRITSIDFVIYSQGCLDEMVLLNTLIQVGMHQ